MDIIDTFWRKLNELEDRISSVLKELWQNQESNKIDEYRRVYSVALDLINNPWRHGSIWEMIRKYKEWNTEFTNEEIDYIISSIAKLENFIATLKHAVTQTSWISTFNESWKFLRNPLFLIDAKPERVGRLLIEVALYLNKMSQNTDLLVDRYKWINLDIDKFNDLWNPWVITEFTLKMLDILIKQWTQNPQWSNINVEEVWLEVLKTWQSVEEVQRWIWVSKMLYSVMLRRVLQDLEKIKNDDVIDLWIRSTNFPLQPSVKEIQNYVNRMGITQIVNHTYIWELIEKWVIKEVVDYEMPTDKLISERIKQDWYDINQTDRFIQMWEGMGPPFFLEPDMRLISQEINTTFIIWKKLFYQIWNHKILVHRYQTKVVVILKNNNPKNSNFIWQIDRIIEDWRNNWKYETVRLEDNEWNQLEASKSILAWEIIKYIMEKLSDSSRLSSEIQELDRSLIALNLMLKAAYLDLLYTHPELKKINSILTETWSIDSRDIRSVSNRSQLEKMIKNIKQLIWLVESIPDDLSDWREYWHKWFWQIIRAVDAIREVQKYPQFRFESLDWL